MTTRREAISAIVKERGEVVIADLAVMLDVSLMTIHRDLNILQEEGQVRKFRGKAFDSKSPKSGIYSFFQDVGVHIQEKQAIAALAFDMIEDGDSVIFDNSTTALQVAKMIRNKKKIIVFAISQGIIDEFYDNPNVLLYCCGGLYSGVSNCFTGPDAERYFDGVRASKCVIGCYGLTVDEGITDVSVLEGSLKKKIIAASAKTILVTDSSKFNRIAMEKIAPLEQIDVLITDAKAQKLDLSEFQKVMDVKIAAL